MFSFHIWVELPPEEMEEQAPAVVKSTFEYRVPGLEELGDEDAIWHFGETRNIEEIKKKMSKLILSVEMENWEKAEMFMDTIKQLTGDAPREVKSPALRLKMAVQKGDYEKTTAAFETLQSALEQYETTNG